jgi:preprotein translocase subunit YajC
LKEDDVFISNAYAQGVGDAGFAGNLTNYLPFLIGFAVLYFMMLRPQMKKQKEQQAMIGALTKGDEVVTAGGVLGKIVKVTDAYVTLEVATGTEMIVQKNAITMPLPKGTIKSL